MLSLFPSLLAWNQLSPFLARVALGAVYLYWAWLRFRDKGSSAGSKAWAVADVIVGLSLVVGLWTQAAAALVAVDLVWRIIKKAVEKSFLTSGVNYYLLLLVLAISLLVTGAGWWAFDLAV